jgi:hypothetical protein
MVSGNGDQPANRPSSTIGGANERAPVAGDDDDPVGVLHDAFQPVLGEQHRKPEVVHESMQDTEHVFGRTGIQSTGRFVEDEYARMTSQHRTDRDALALAAG